MENNLNSITNKLQGFKVPLLERALNTLIEIRDEYMTAVKEDVIIVSSEEWEKHIEISEENDLNSQLMRLLRTAREVEGNTKYCSPILIFEEDSYLARDRYVSSPFFRSTDPIKALKQLLEHYVGSRESIDSIGVSTSKYKYFYPAGKERSDKLTASRS